MSEDLQNYEMVSIYRLNADDQERLLNRQRECVFNWCTKDEWPVGVIMSYIWRKGRVWLTGGAHRHRISACGATPRCPWSSPAPARTWGRPRPSPSRAAAWCMRTGRPRTGSTRTSPRPAPRRGGRQGVSGNAGLPLAGGAGGGAGEVHHLRRRKDVGAHRRHLGPCRVGGALGVRHRAPAAGNQAAAPVGGPARWVAPQHRRRSPILAAGPS